MSEKEREKEEREAIAALLNAYEQLVVAAAGETREGKKAEKLRKVIDEMAETYGKAMLITVICCDAVKTSELAATLRRRGEIGNVTLN
jgi:hypothetical protein